MVVKDFQSPTERINLLLNNAKKGAVNLLKIITHKVEIKGKSKSWSNSEGQNQVKSKSTSVSRRCGFSSEASGNNQ